MINALNNYITVTVLIDKYSINYIGLVHRPFIYHYKKKASVYCTLNRV